MQISIAALGELLICICSVSFTHFSSRENPQSLTNSHDHSNKSTLGRVDSERWSYPIFDLKSGRDAGPTPPVDSSVPHCVVRGGSNDWAPSSRTPWTAFGGTYRLNIESKNNAIVKETTMNSTWKQQSTDDTCRKHSTLKVRTRVLI